MPALMLFIDIQKHSEKKNLIILRKYHTFYKRTKGLSVIEMLGGLLGPVVGKHISKKAVYEFPGVAITSHSSKLLTPCTS